MMQEIDCVKRVTALILAGGRGTRIAALTPDVPKPMVNVAGQPFLEWLIRRLLKEHITRIVLSLGHMANVITAWVDTRSGSMAREEIRCHAETQPLGTGGAIADSLPYINTPYVLIMNGDTLLLSPFAPALRRVITEGLDGAIMARALPDTGRYGRLIVKDGLLKEFEEKTPGHGLINGGVYVFVTDWLRQQLKVGASSLETDIIPQMLKNGAKIGVVVTEAPFIDIGTPETLATANEFVTDHKEYF